MEKFGLDFFPLIFPFFFLKKSIGMSEGNKISHEQLLLAFIFKVYGIMQRQCCLLSYMPWENMMFHDLLAVGYVAIYHTKRNQNFIKIFLIAFEDVAFSLIN